MTSLLPSVGLWMLLTLAVLVLLTGLPVWALLIGTASLFATAGWWLGVMDMQVLSSIGGRTLGLLEHDLLQALPLYVLVGVLLQRMTLADAVFTCFGWLLRRTGAAQSLAALGVGLWVAPMNGSVASSSALLARLVYPKLGTMDATRSTALVSVAATLGVVVPPSLVLILLGDAMLRAHTEASNLPGFVADGQRIVNTQDVFHGALLPAAAVLVLWFMVAWWQGRGGASSGTQSRPRAGQWAQAGAAIGTVVVLLSGVYLGQVFAVEAAATACMVLMAAAVVFRSLSGAQWQAVLHDTLALSGALLALLVGATTFSLVFRLWGTDHWLTSLVLGSSLSPRTAALLVLLLVALCAWVLDAFEMIFVVIPIVAPLLVLRLGDAQQVSVLLLLVLQLSFLMPPLGYAVMMARSLNGQVPASHGALFRALLPYLLAQCAVAAVVFAWPPAVHQLDAALPPPTDQAPLSAQEIEQQMRDMSEPPPAQDAARP